MVEQGVENHDQNCRSKKRGKECKQQPPAHSSAGTLEQVMGRLPALAEEDVPDGTLILPFKGPPSSWLCVLLGLGEHLLSSLATFGVAFGYALFGGCTALAMLPLPAGANSEL